jgi:beta-1,4-mannosyltransferase
MLRSTGSAGRHSIKVLLVLDRPTGETRFVDQITREAPARVHFKYFSWTTALFAPWQLMHVHWPEFLVRDRNLLRRLVRGALGVLLLIRLTVTGAPVVRTLHNLEPHARGTRFEDWFVAALWRRTSRVVLLQEHACVEEMADKHPTVIRHGHYRDVFAETAAARPHRVLFAGRIEPYKNLSALLGAFKLLPLPDASLVVVGNCAEEDKKTYLMAADGDERISFEFGFVEDAVLVDAISQSSLVVLPYKHLYNSGIFFVALSLNRPVLVPRNEATEAVRAEVGDSWVHFFDGDLTAADLLVALENVARPTADRPELSGRDWSVVAEKYAQVYDEEINNV